MNKIEMLNKLLKQSGWEVTADTDEDGCKIVVATTETERAAV